MKKCLESGDDVYLALLDLRNTPRDEQTGSPMQRLMGRRAKTLLPISNGLQKPTTVQPETVSSKLTEYRQKQKFYYDRGAKERAQCQLLVYTIQKVGNRLSSLASRKNLVHT